MTPKTQDEDKIEDEIEEKERERRNKDMISEGVQGAEIVEEMEKAYIDYAMSVIVQRALPSVEDGLKPVHRRILYAMNELGLDASKPTKKSATIVGNVIGKFHPHGDIAVYDALVRLAQDFSLRYPLIHGQGNFGCFTADTKVKLADGRNLSFKDLIEEDSRGKTNFTFTVDGGNIKIAEIKNPRMTKENAEIIKVILDNGGEIKCTLNHLFMLRDGSYKEARNLKSGDSLMPCYTKLSTEIDSLRNPKTVGYSMVFQPELRSWDYVHVLADIWNLDNQIYLKNSGRIRHHIDFNKLNNNPTNIKRMHWKEHWQTHYNLTSSKHQNDFSYRKKLEEGREKFWSDPRNREAYSIRMRERNLANWKNRNYREKKRLQLSKINKKYFEEHPEVIERIRKTSSITMKRMWQIQEYKELFHKKIVMSNKKRETNLTGKKKFLRICMHLLHDNLPLTKENFENIRKNIFGIKSFTSWDHGIKKYFNEDINLILNELNGNHKVVGIEFPNEYTDVYDLTIDNTHNFALAAGIFVHNSLDGDSAAAYRYCIAGDSLILTDKGLIKIDKLSNKEEIDIKILSKDKKINKAVKWFDSGEHPTKRIITDKGYNVTGTYNHPILTLNRDESGKPVFLWKLLEQLKEGDIAVLDRLEDDFWPIDEINLEEFHPQLESKRIKIRKLPEKLNADLAFILGSLIAEGYIGQNKIEFCNTDKEWIEMFEKKWCNLFPDSKLHKFLKSPSSYGKKDYYRLECHCLHTLEFLRNIGLTVSRAKDKEIPELILRSPKNVMKEFVRSYFEGDGSLSFTKKMMEIRACSTSPELIRVLQEVMLRFGIDSFRRYDKHKNLHLLQIRGKRNFLRFYKEIGFVSDRKSKKLELILALYRKDYSQRDYVPFISDFIRGITYSEFIAKNNFDRYENMSKNYGKVVGILKEKTKQDYAFIFEYLLTYKYLFDRVKIIQEAGVQKVYSVKVESECHSFVANGFINHNTEARLSKIAQQLLEDIDKETVKMNPNFDNSEKEPETLPGKLPNLLLNGATGIAVGMATNIPPHNLSELCDAITSYIDNPEVSIDDLIQIVKGPDFPTGGFALGPGIAEMYKTGKGKIVMRARTSEEEKKGKEYIIVTEIPYMVNKADLVKDIARLATEKKLPDIADIWDESAKGKIRIVIELKKGVDSKYTLNKLYKLTNMQTNFDANILALVGKQPRVLNLKDVVSEYVKYRRIVVTNRSKFELKKAEDRLEIVVGLLIALKHIDEIVDFIKKCKSTAEAHEGLMKKWNFSDRQAKAVLETRLQQLTSLEHTKLKDEEAKLKEAIEYLKKVLDSDKEVLKIIRREISEVRKDFGDERRTRVIKKLEEISEEDMIEKKDVVVMLTSSGYIKRVDVKTYKEQRRGGAGVIGAGLKEEDFVMKMITCSTHDYLLFFTSRGRVYWLKSNEVPSAERQSKGRAIANLLNLRDEKIANVMAITNFDSGYLMFATKLGMVKKLPTKDVSNPRSTGVRIMNLPVDGSDEIINVTRVEDGQEVLLVTKDGQAIRFNSDAIRSMGRASYGVIGIDLGKGDAVVSLMAIPKDGKTTVLTVTRDGYGKRSDIEEYRKTARAGKGVINLKTTDKTGDVVASVSVNDKDSIIATTVHGIVIRISMKDLRVMGRATQGVRVVRLKERDKVADVVKVPIAEGISDKGSLDEFIEKDK